MQKLLPMGHRANYCQVLLRIGNSITSEEWEPCWHWIHFYSSTLSQSLTNVYLIFSNLRHSKSSNNDSMCARHHYTDWIPCSITHVLLCFKWAETPHGCRGYTQTLVSFSTKQFRLNSIKRKSRIVSYICIVKSYCLSKIIIIVKNILSLVLMQWLVLKATFSFHK